MIPQGIVDLMKRQPGDVARPEAEQAAVDTELARLGLSGDEEISEFFKRYSLAGVLSNKPFELLDLCTPTPQIYEATEFGRDSFEVKLDYICLTSGEDEGFVLLRKSDGMVFNVGIDELDDLEAGNIGPRWRSFFSLLHWYLSPNVAEGQG